MQALLSCLEQASAALAASAEFAVLARSTLAELGVPALPLELLSQFLLELISALLLELLFEILQQKLQLQLAFESHVQMLEHPRPRACTFARSRPHSQPHLQSHAHLCS